MTTAGKILATRILQSNTILIPTQKIKIDPTQDKLSNATGDTTEFNIIASTVILP